MAKKFKLIESETVELKSSLSERQEILDTISAFSNTRGGLIYIGVDPHGKVIGIDDGYRTFEDLANEIKQNTDPKVFPTIEGIIIDNKNVLLIKVPEYPTKPVWAKDRVFLRVGRSNQRASAEKIRHLIYKSKIFKWDHQIQTKVKLSEIDAERLKLFLQKVEEERNTTFESPRSAEKILEKLSLSKEGHLTNASLLLFGKDPQKHFIQSEIRCARFNGIEPIEFSDMQVINGTLIEQVPAVLNFIRRHINVSVQITGEPERKEIWEYPKEAIREAIINAICHRNYEDTGNVQVRIYHDRLEVWNPGKLPEGLTLEMLRKDHQSRPRNDLIAKCFYLLKYIEQWGTGTNRMIKLCQEAKLPSLEFFELSDSFIVRFIRKSQKAGSMISSTMLKLNDTQKKIIEYLEKNGEANTYDLMKYLKLTERTVQRHINLLKEIIEWNGESVSDPKGKYTLIKTP